MICPLTHLGCLRCCGGPHGNRCTIAPAHDYPATLASFSDPRISAVYATQALAIPGAPTLALAQLTEQGALASYTGVDTTGALRHALISAARPQMLTAEQYATENGVGLVYRAFRGSVLFPLSDGRQIRFWYGIQSVPANLADHFYIKTVSDPAQMPSPVPVSEPSVKPLLERVVTAGEQIGWRIWEVRSDGLLKSYARDNVWQPGVPMQGMPQDDGSAGVWAFKDKAQALRKVADNRYISRFTNKVAGYAWGAVLLWGEGIEHQIGWRAEYARIISLDGVVPLMTPDTGSRVRRSRTELRRPRRMLTGLRCRYRVSSFCHWQRQQQKPMQDLD
jgi:hypothetical protein